MLIIQTYKNEKFKQKKNNRTEEIETLKKTNNLIAINGLIYIAVNTYFVVTNHKH